MFPKHETIAGYDNELAQAMADEARRQEDHVELIASENYASPRVMEAQGSVLTNKYAEGYPGKRYYGGCEYVDIAERLAIDRVKQLFGADYANVQPHSGSQANQAVYLALLQPGDTILGMSLAHGGHLTHGAKVNISGKLLQRRAVRRRTSSGLIDYDEVERLAARAQAEDDRRRLLRLFAGRSTGRASAPSPTRSARTCSSTWPTSPAWSPPACTRTRCRTRTWSPPPRTRRCAVRAAASSCAPRGRRRRDREEAAVDRVPRHPGRPADARDRRQGGRLQGGAGAGVQDLPGSRW